MNPHSQGISSTVPFRKHRGSYNISLIKKVDAPKVIACSHGMYKFYSFKVVKRIYFARDMNVEMICAWWHGFTQVWLMALDQCRDVCQKSERLPYFKPDFHNLGFSRNHNDWMHHLPLSLISFSFLSKIVRLWLTPILTIVPVPRHDAVIKWKHFPRYWPFVRGIHRSVTRSFGVLFDLRLNKQLSKQSWGWWFETPSPPLLRHCNESSHEFRDIWVPSVRVVCRLIRSW